MNYEESLYLNMGYTNGYTNGYPPKFSKMTILIGIMDDHGI